MVTTLVVFLAFLIPGFLLSRIFSGGEEFEITAAPISFLLSLAAVTQLAVICLLAHWTLSRFIIGFIITSIILLFISLWKRKNFKYSAFRPNARPSSYGLPITFFASLIMWGYSVRIFRRHEWDAIVLLIIFVGINSLLAFHWIKKGKIRTHLNQDTALGYGRVNLFLLVLFFLGSLIAIWVCYKFPYRPTDDWTYLAYIREYIDGFRMNQSEPFMGSGYPVNARMIFNIWGVIVAVLSKVSKVDPIVMVRGFLPPMLLGMCILSFYAFSRELFSRTNTALYTTIFLLAFFISSRKLLHVELGGSPYVIFFARLVHDKALTAFVLLPLTSLLAIKYVTEGQINHFILTCLAVMVLSFMHPIGLPLFSISFGSFTTMTLIFDPKPIHKKRTLHLCVPICLFLLIPLWQRMMIDFVPYDVLLKHYERSGPFEHLSQLRQRRILTLSPNFYILQPYWLKEPMILLGIALTPFVTPFLKKEISARYLFGTMAIPLLISYNPLFAPILGRLISPWMLWRVTWILPIPLVFAFFCEKVTLQWGRKLSGIFGSRLSYCIVMPVVLVLALWLVRWSHGKLYHVKYVLQGELPNIERMSEESLGLLRYIQKETMYGSGFLAPREVNTLIPAFKGDGYVVAFRKSQTVHNLGMERKREALERCQEVEEFCEIVLDNEKTWELIKKYRLKYLILLYDSPASEKLLRRLQLRFENERYKLYEVPRGGIPSEGKDESIGALRD